jgi:hypothetical protein
MSKMGSNCSFGHLKHKLWAKERPGVKLAVWLPTTKSQESTQFPCVQATCDILLKSSRRGLQLFFWLHCDRSSSQEVMHPQSRGSPGWCNFGTPSWESRLMQFRDSLLGVPGQNTICMWPPWWGTEYTIKGKVVASPKSGPWWILCVRVAHGSS